MSGKLLASDIREILLAVIEEQKPTSNMQANLQQVSVLTEASRRLTQKLAPQKPIPSDQFAARYSQQLPQLTPEMEEALLTQWGELFRTGLLAWGLNLSNPGPPFFHLTESGKNALANATRDPSNPAGYLRHLDSIAPLNPVSRSYLVEGLDCYVAGLTKAAAVMIGAAAEALIVELAEQTNRKLISLGRPSSKGLTDWKVKTMTDTLRTIFESQKLNMGKQLSESVDANWPAFSYQIRATRNEAGHPTSVDPVTPDRVHAALLVFPELAKLADSLRQWITANLL